MFNSGLNSSNYPFDYKKLHFSGYAYGLQVELYVNFAHYLSIFNLYLGSRIKVENSTYLSNSIENDGINAASGSITDVGVDRIFEYNLPKPYTACDIDNQRPNEFNSKFYKMIDESVYQYDQDLCLDLCYQNLLINECNCTSVCCFSLFKNVETCNDRQLECINKTFYLKWDAVNFKKDNCYPHCPLQCNRTIFRTTASTTNIIGHNFAELINENIHLSSDFNVTKVDKDLGRISVVKLNVYYNSLSFMISEDSPSMTIISLIAAIGGTLGLFLGVSMLSLCEIIQVLIEIYCTAEKKNNVRLSS